MSLVVKDGNGVEQYLKTEGSGTSGDPFIPVQKFSNLYEQATIIQDNLGNQAEVGLFGGLKTTTAKPQISETFDNPRKLSRFKVTGTVTPQTNRSLLKVDQNSSAQTIKVLRYKTAQTIETYFTAGFNGNFANGKSIIGLFDEYDGVYLGYNDGNFIVGYRNVFGQETASWDGSAVVNPVPDVVQIISAPQNVENVTRYRIKFGYLGVGNISYEYFDGTNWVLLHVFQTDNALPDRTHVGSAILPMRCEVEDTLGCFILSGSWNAQTYGEDTGIQDSPIHIRGYRDGDGDLVINTPRALVAFRSKSTFGDYPNKIMSRLLIAEFWLRAEGVSEIEIYKLPAGTIQDGSWEETPESALEYNDTTNFNSVVGDSIFSTPIAVPSSGIGVASKVLDFQRLGLVTSGSEEYLIAINYRLDGGTSSPERGWNITYEDLF
jgi:hypothetical protein